ncbi:hypothetical protein BV96_02286 [Sphingomonas paucimobilis]|nr:hypothetical protein BV96_02286 [Sphingomonas paucimobilis]
MRLVLIAFALSGCSDSALLRSDASTLTRDPKFAVFVGEGPFVINGPDEARFISPASVDYVAVMENAEVPNEKVTVYRSANFLREDLSQNGQAYTRISDLKSGASFRFAGDRDDPRSLAFRGAVSARPTKAYPTRGSDNVLGERCQIWAFDRHPEYSDMCLTMDGIILWRKQYRPGGTVERFDKAVTLTRRAIRSAELSFPTDLLKWSTWMANSQFDRSDRPNDEVVLEGRDGWSGGRKMQIIRRLGANASISESDSQGMRQRLNWAAFDIRFYRDKFGNPVELTINPTGIDARVPPAAWVVPTKYEIVRGYRCGWREAMRHSEGETNECRSSNGMLLKSTSRYVGSITELAARSISIGNLTKDDFRPPAAWLTIGTWTMPAAKVRRNASKD